MEKSQSVLEKHQQAKIGGAKARNGTELMTSGDGKPLVAIVLERPIVSGDQGSLSSKSRISKLVRQACKVHGIRESQIAWCIAFRSGKQIPHGLGEVRQASLTQRDIEAQRPLLIADLKRLDPYVVLALGPLTARTILNQSITIGDRIGAATSPEGFMVYATSSPALLDAFESAEQNDDIRNSIVRDLAQAIKTALAHRLLAAHTQ